MTGRTRPAEALERALKALLEQLERPAASAHGLEAAVASCAAAFEALRAIPHDELGAHDLAAVERACRVLPLVRELAQRELGDADRRLRLVRNARRAFAAQSVPEHGGSCDVAG